MTISGWAAQVARGGLVPHAYEPAPLGPHDVEVAISHCGICHSDIHLIDDDWGNGGFPLMPGHEIVGTVSAVGEAETVAVGQRVGIGWQRSACGVCRTCREGHENLCDAQTATCSGHPGGFARAIRTDGRFVFPLPEGMDAATTAPLLCGGATVFSPMRRFGVNASSCVGVVGIGGLGHMALQLLRAFGCEVVAFTSSPGKHEDARRLGAHEAVPSTEPREIRKHANRFDLLIATVSVRLDWTTYIGTLRPNGVLCFVGALPGLLAIPPAAFFNQQRMVTGSRIGSPGTIAELLRFAALHKIAPCVERRPLAEVNAALERVRRNEVRYRMVLEVD